MRMTKALVTAVVCAACGSALAAPVDAAEALGAIPAVTFGTAGPPSVKRADATGAVQSGGPSRPRLETNAASIAVLERQQAGETPSAGDAQTPPQRRPLAITYSRGYEIRAKIHRWASYPTLPLFGAQYLLGEKLMSGSTSEPIRFTHAAIATTMVGLWGLNTVTGAWNLWEGRKDPAGRGRRLAHAMLMLGSDAGFMATGALAPTNEGGGNRDLHRAMALTSIGVASAGYLLMLLTH